MVLRALVLSISLLSLGCANSGACASDDECGTLRYCREGSCRQDCTSNETCGTGRICTSTGMCVVGFADAGVDGGGDAGLDAPLPFDAGPLDAPLPPMLDAPTLDAPIAMPDAPPGLDAFAPMDAFVPFDAGVDAGVDAGSDAGRDAGRDAGGALTPSTYTYTRQIVGGLNEAVGVAFHPDGSYAIVLERNDEVHLFDWLTRTAMRFDVRVAGRTVYLDDVIFSADGSVAWIVGYERVASTDSAVIIQLSDAAYRAGDGLASFSRLAAAAPGERFAGIALPTAASSGPGGGHPVVLSQSGTSPYIARLRELDPATGTFTGLFVARSTSAGCDDLAFSDNEFGTWGLVLACGTNGAEILYYTEIAGVGEWRAGSGGFGNVSRTDAHPSGAYALIVNWSSRFLHRHEGGALRPTGSSPGIAPSIWDVSFSPDGRLALITGRALGTSLRGTVYEYRHDLYSAAEITDVSIEGFSLPPYSATTSTTLNDSAWRPGCDGGLIVGGSVSPSTGLVIAFERTLGTRCP